jgi:hypothetical protein
MYRGGCSCALGLGPLASFCERDNGHCDLFFYILRFCHVLVQN